MTTRLLPWFAALAVVVIGLAIAIPNRNAIAIAWTVARDAPLNRSLDRIAAARGAFEGYSEARHDLAAGYLRLKMAAVPALDKKAFEDLFRTRLGVTIVSVPGSMSSTERFGNYFAYNEVMTEEIARRHGRQALEKAYGDGLGVVPAPVRTSP